MTSVAMNPVDMSAIRAIVSVAIDAREAIELVTEYCRKHGLPPDEVLQQVGLSHANEADAAIDGMLY